MAQEMFEPKTLEIPEDRIACASSSGDRSPSESADPSLFRNVSFSCRNAGTPEFVPRETPPPTVAASHQEPVHHHRHHAPPPVTHVFHPPPPASPQFVASSFEYYDRGTFGDHKVVQAPVDPDPPPPPPPATEIPTEEEAAIGNPEFIRMLKREGHLGVFYKRDHTTRIPTFLTLDAERYRNAITLTLTAVLRKALEEEGNSEVADQTATNIANDLLSGICILTYLKLRSLNALIYAVESEKFRKKPFVPSCFVVPEPYALAISQLGMLRPTGLAKQKIYGTTISSEEANRYLLPEGNRWSVAGYDRAVETAKRLKVRFATVDLTAKSGSSWWLYGHQQESDNSFYLTCPLPEENFTVHTAALHLLFCVNQAGGFYNPIFDLGPLGPDRYGTMARNLPPRIDLAVFYAVESVSPDAGRVS